MIQLNRIAGISQKYDATLDYGIDMYDKLPYQRNSDVCNSGAVAMFSGHIIKYYLCLNQEEAFEINNHDDEIEQILRRIRQEELSRLEESANPQTAVPADDELTDEQLHALTKDNDAESEDAPPKEIIDLDDIEDW